MKRVVIQGFEKLEIHPNKQTFLEKHAIMAKNHRFHGENGGFYGCGGRTRTYDLRVMSDGEFLENNSKIPNLPLIP